MKSIFYTLALVSLFGFIGCNAEKAAPVEDAHAGHNHAEGEVCQETAGAEHAHSHSIGPKGGQLAILGSHEFHVELVKGADGKFSAYLYDPQFNPIKNDTTALTFSYMADGKLVSVEFTKTEDGASFVPAADTVFPDDWNHGASVMTKINGVPYNQKLADPEEEHDHQ